MQMAMASSSSVALRRYAERALVEHDLELEIGMDMRISPQMFRRLVKALRVECGSGDDTLQMDMDAGRLDSRKRDARLEFRGRDLIEAALASGVKGPSIGPGSVTPSRVLEKNRENPTIQHEDYDYKIKLKREQDVTAEEAASARGMDPGAHFRIKRRFSFPVATCRVDCTVVQERLAGDVTSTDLPFKYEVEVEFLNREAAKGNPDTVVEDMSRLARQCVCVMTGNSRPPTRKERVEVLDDLAAAAADAAAEPPSRLANASTSVALEGPEHGSALAQTGQDASLEEAVRGGAVGRKRFTHRLLGPQPVTLMRRHVQPPPPSPSTEGAAGDASVPLDTIWLGAYTVTDKADGLRCQLIVRSGTAYTVDSAMVMRRCIEKVPAAAEGTWLDGELVTSGSGGTPLNMFAAFDIYRSGQRPVAGLPLLSPPGGGESRLAHLQGAIKMLGQGSALDGFDARAKRFAVVDAAGHATREALDVARTQREYETDGLIFTPAYLPVGARHDGDTVHIEGAWPQTMKWKEPNQNTIDFLVRVSSSLAGASGGAVSATGANEDSGTRYLSFDVFASYIPRQWEPVDVTKYIQFGDQAFPSNEPRARRFDIGGTDGARMRVSLDASGHPVCQDGDTIYPETIVECARANGHWTPLRTRPEKTARLAEDGIARAANNWGTALGVWQSIVEPVTVSMIDRLEDAPPPKMVAGPGGDSIDAYYSRRDFGRERSVLYRMTSFHNIIVKAHLYRTAASSSSAVGAPALFEMACGKGGDMNRWIDRGFSPVVGIDLSLDNIVNAENGVYARMKGKTSPDRVMVFVRMDASTRMRPPLDDVRYAASGSPHGDVINALWDASKRPLTSTAFSPLRGLVHRGFDVVACQFAIHYLFENDMVLDRFVSNVDFLLRAGGVFIGTCFDGDRLARELEHAPGGSLIGSVGSHRAWEITRRYTGPFSGTTGAAVDVFVETINQTLTEYLVSPRVLTSRLQAIGLEPMFVRPFSDMFSDKHAAALDMTSTERALSAKYMMFAFRRAKVDVAAH
jgi:mRNA capping enzyme